MQTVELRVGTKVVSMAGLWGCMSVVQMAVWKADSTVVLRAVRWAACLADVMVVVMVVLSAAKLVAWTAVSTAVQWVD